MWKLDWDSGKSDRRCAASFALVERLNSNRAGSGEKWVWVPDSAMFPKLSVLFMLLLVITIKAAGYDSLLLRTLCAS